jgi:hypothetical protein
VQGLLTGVLRMIFEDVRVEEPSPAQAGASSRLDFVLKRQRIIVEVKVTRQGLCDRDVGKQLIEDIERYRGHPDGDALLAIVYDPARHVRNPRGLETISSGITAVSSSGSPGRCRGFSQLRGNAARLQALTTAGLSTRGIGTTKRPQRRRKRHRKAKPNLSPDERVTKVRSVD